ncbi:response regulator [Spirosoma sp. BT702]|uniref:Response regulator n=1 Tax=Spirosoma profusum TaxID=2771354 RepID=A0A926Y593_9BACT|nr:response regulator [Spirosoma profusum]MBD2704211.1 response regulator [Spirosoma profusum]
MVDILYVEDNPDDADIFSRLVTKFEQSPTYTILESGSEAIDYLTGKDGQQRRTLPKLLLLDLNLVGLSGFDVVKRLRAADHTRWLPIVSYSTSDNPNDIREAYAAGINAYVVKPGNYQATRELLQHLCRFWLENNTLLNFQ